MSASKWQSVWQSELLFFNWIEYYMSWYVIINQLFRFTRATTGRVEGSDMPGMGLVRDGTSCGDNLVIIIIPYFLLSRTIMCCVLVSLFK